MDDSRAALNTAYSAVRERYNRLRLQHRQLRKDHTCLQCRQKLNTTVDIENSPDKQITPVASRRSPNDVNEINEICDQLKQIAEAGQIADSCCAIETIIPRLQSVASRMTTNADDRQESLLNASASGTLDALSNRHLGALVTGTCNKSLNSDLLLSQQVETDATVMEISEDFKTCEISGDSDYLVKHLTAGRLVIYLQIWYCIKINLCIERITRALLCCY